MAATVANLAVANVLLAIFILIMAPFGAAFTFFLYKGVQPVKARSKVLFIGQYIGCVCFFAGQYLAITGDGSCSVGMKFFTTLTELIIVSILLRCVRLVLIFSITKYRLKNKDNAKSLDFYVSEKFMAILLVFFNIIFCGGTSLGYINSQHDYDCTNAYSTLGGLIIIIILLFGFIGVGIKLRKVHDAYFLKNEFKLILITTVALGVPGFVLSSYSSTKYWGNIVVQLDAIFSAVWSFVVPCILAFKQYRENHRSSSMSSEIPSKYDENSKEMVETPIDSRESEFSKFPNIIKIIQSPSSEKFVRAYVLHYQVQNNCFRSNIKDSTSTDLLNFHAAATEFRLMAPEFRTGKGYLLFQKFISHNAYRYIACLEEGQRKSVESNLTAAMEENAKSVSEELFDDILSTVEKELIDKLYKPFMKSEFFVKWKEAMLLNERLA